MINYGIYFKEKKIIESYYKMHSPVPGGPWMSVTGIPELHSSRIRTFYRLFQRYIEITHDSLLFSVAQGILWLSPERLSRSTWHLIEGERGAIVLSCIDPSVRIVTTSSKVGPRIIFSISLVYSQCFHSRFFAFGSTKLSIRTWNHIN